MSKTLICDLESNGLTDYTELWCVVTYCLEDKELKVFEWRPDRGHIKEFEEYARDATLWIGHNFIDYDRHVLDRLTELPLIPVSRINDTLVRSRLYNSGRTGGHALERWGAYFGVPKVGTDIEDWSYYQPIMRQRCVSDVGITLKLYKFQLKEGKRVGKNAEDLEQRFVELCGSISDRGFPIDVPLLDKKYSLMSSRRSEVEAEIQRAFPPRPIKVASVSPKKTKSGAYAKNTKGFKQFKDFSIIKGPFTLIEWQEFNVRSNKQVVERMTEYGWKPYIRTKSGKGWKVCEENLETLPPNAPEEAKLIVEFLKLDTRVKLMDNWYANLKDGRVHGSIIHVGAITHRCAHHDPNTANIPGNDEWNIRECWAVSGDRHLVGCDAKGIQLRILDHLTRQYTDDDSFTRQVLDGDPHGEFTLPIVGQACPEANNTRAMCKRFIYAWLLGAGNQKVGTIFNVDASKGKLIGEVFVELFPGLSELKAYLARCAKKGWFPAPDGRFIPIKSEHYALSVALQGIEAVLMKLAMLLWQAEARSRNLDAHFIAFVHDEVQIDAHKDCAEEAGQLMRSCIQRAGEMLRLRTPMDGDYQVGMNWSETH